MYELSSSTWDDKEITAIHAVINSDRYTMGGQVEAFEKEFAEHFGSKYAVMVNSGSSANLLAIAALSHKKLWPLEAGDEVIVPCLSWSTMFYPVHQYGLHLVFVDIDEDTLNVDIQCLEAAMSKRTKAIFVPNILGNPAMLIELSDFCKEHALYLIEDNCEGMGAKLDGKYAGTFGVCGTFSMFWSHHICTMEGGMIITDDEEIYHILLSMRSHGWTRHLPQSNRVCLKGQGFGERFRFVLPGYNVRPIEMMGAIGREQLKKLDGFVEQRRLNALYFKETFAGDSRFRLQKEHGDSSWFAFSMVLREQHEDFRPIFLKLLEAADIEIRPIASGNFLAHDVVRQLDHRVAAYPFNAVWVHDHGFYVGNHGHDIRDKIDYLKETLGTA